MKWCVELFDDSDSEPDFDEPMECDICKRTADKDGVVLHRINETGVKGIWRCSEHLTARQRAQVDPIVDDLTLIIEQDNKKE